MLRKTISVPNELFFKEVKALLDEGKKVRIPVKGKSMRPFLQDGDTVLLTQASNRPIRWGTIVVAHTTVCGIVLHRVVYQNKNGLWLVGDAHSRQKEHTTAGDVLAVVAAAYGRDRKPKLDSFGSRCAVVLWFLILPFRGYLLRVYDVLSRKK